MRNRFVQITRGKPKNQRKLSTLKADILSYDLSAPLPGNDVVPFGAVLPFAWLVLVALIGGHAELGKRNAARRVLDFGILA